MRLFNTVTMAVAVMVAACSGDSSESEGPDLPDDGDFYPEDAGFKENGCLLEETNIVLSLTVVADGDGYRIELPPGEILGAEVDGASAPVGADGSFEWEISGLYSTLAFDENGNQSECVAEVRTRISAKTIDDLSFEIVEGVIQMLPATNQDDPCEEAFQEVAPGYTLADGCASSYSTIMNRDV